jgi:alpha-beta hydrolase superfamily lysophospholipase
LVCGALGVSACGEGDKSSDQDTKSGNAQDDGLFALGVPCEDKADELYTDPGALPDEQGAIIRCVDDGLISKDDIASQLDGLVSDSRDDVEAIAAGGGTVNTYEGPAPESGAHRYRILYRTERGNGDPGSSVALVYVPDQEPKAKVPLMLLARGSRGQAPNCAPSLTTPGPITSVDSPDGRYVQDDLTAMVWPLVASGFAVVVTDSAGYANYGAQGNPPSGYADVQDAGKSFIDSGHALHKLLPNGTTTDVLMVGLSQGGHTMLGALEVSNQYPAPGKILGAAAYSPLWFAQRAWGSAVSPLAPAGGLFLNQSSAVPVSIWYHYTHAEIHDGPGEGVKLFKPEYQSAIKDFVDTTCWSNVYKKLEDSVKDPPEGGITAAEFFTQEFDDAVGLGAYSRSCDDSPDQALCNKWLDRYRADHPVLTGAAAKVPILLAYGLKDTRIPAQRFKCAVEKLEQSGNSLEFCIDPEANHTGVVLRQSEYVNQWLLGKALGSAPEGKCPSTTPPPDACDPLNVND